MLQLVSNTNFFVAFSTDSLPHFSVFQRILVQLAPTIFIFSMILMVLNSWLINAIALRCIVILSLIIWPSSYWITHFTLSLFARIQLAEIEKWYHDIATFGCGRFPTLASCRTRPRIVVVLFILTRMPRSVMRMSGMIWMMTHSVLKRCVMLTMRNRMMRRRWCPQTTLSQPWIVQIINQTIFIIIRWQFWFHLVIHGFIRICWCQVYRLVNCGVICGCWR